jgi:chemotaxis protein CheZ
VASQQVVKEFSVERQLRQRRYNGAESVSNADLLEAIHGLRREIAELRETGPAVANISEEDMPGFKESQEVRIEIAQMVRSIGRAKMEIASIKHPMSDDDRMRSAASELDAIVVATETSTNDILQASENIEKMTRDLAGIHHNDEEIVTTTEKIANEIIAIFEACNFQDITGQRTNKVITTLRYIEARILSMIDIWGADAFTDLPVKQEADGNGDDALMNGPQLENQGISQEDINALFD